jgi:DNA-binding GntR family transcriptional regulator
VTRGLQRFSTVDALVAELRGRILDGELAAGTRLVELELVGEYEVARHTLRAALRGLAGEGLVELVPNRGAQVVSARPGDLEELYELRTALETEAARLALVRNREGLAAALDEAVVELRAVCESADPPWSLVADAHAAVHRSIVESADSPRIAAAYAGLTAELRLLLLALRPVWALPRMVSHHEELARDLLTRGPEALREHLADGVAAVLGGA